jgi:DNA-binding FrmR family transcriptional regulator
MSSSDKKPTRLKRLNRIEGQVRGIARMVEEDRYCIDILTQIAAVRAALQRVEQDVLEEHMQHCVHQAFANGSPAEHRKMIAELMELLGRAAR